MVAVLGWGAGDGEPHGPGHGDGELDGEDTYRPIRSPEWECEDGSSACDWPGLSDEEWGELPEEAVPWSEEAGEACWPIIEELLGDAPDDEREAAYERYDECLAAFEG